MGVAGEHGEVSLERDEFGAGARGVRDVQTAFELRRVHSVPREVRAETVHRRLPLIGR